MQPSGQTPGSYGSNYLETEVLTATPQKLQLMMIEGAIRFTQRAKLYLQEEKHEEFCESVIRAEEIVAEIMAVMDPKPAPELVGQVASVYLFVYRRLMEANLNRDEAMLDDVLRVLGEERITWRLVCEKLGAQQQPGQEDKFTSGATSQTPPAPAETPSSTPPAAPTTSLDGLSAMTPNAAEPSSPQPNTPTPPTTAEPASSPPPARKLDTYGAQYGQTMGAPLGQGGGTYGQPSAMGSTPAGLPGGYPTTPPMGTPPMNMPPMNMPSGQAPPVPPLPNPPGTDTTDTPAGGLSFEA